VIRAAYRVLATKYHPDRNPGDRRAELRLKQLNAAFHVLGNPQKRRLYDELTQGADESPAPSASAHVSNDQPPTPLSTGEDPSPDEAPSQSQTCWNCGAQMKHDALRCAVCWKTTLRRPRGSDVVAGARAQRSESRIARSLVALLVLAVVVGTLAALANNRSSNSVLPESTRSVPPPPVETSAIAEHSTAVGPESLAPAPTTPQSPTPVIPPLLDGESPPDETPNYFDAREISSGGIVVMFDSCKAEALKSSPKLSREDLGSYCLCVTDAVRRNFRTTGNLTKSGASWEQVQTCLAFGNTIERTLSGRSSTSPYASIFPRDTSNIILLLHACSHSRPSGSDPNFTSTFCDCYVDAELKGKGPNVPASDRQKCEVIAQHWADTRSRLTVRQFKLLKLTN
jgi:hypothetical protein